jgi:predicted nucleotidyltransferase component of viral defense system
MMDNAILQMLAEYDCRSVSDYENALKEIMQEIALLGLWRAKFYERALFYGGSSLRILYGLTRFSEDLDFSLLKPDAAFDLSKYTAAIVAEMEGFGFAVEVQKTIKSVDSQIDSAFIKAGTKITFVKIKAPERLLGRLHTNRNMKVKIGVDLDPPGNHGVEVKDIFRPIPFQVKTMPLADLFAGKMHALLARSWQTRVKGRDYYDYLWYLGKKSPLNLRHLEARLRQSGHLSELLTTDLFKKMLTRKFKEVDIETAKKDISPFLKDREKATLDLWSNAYFIESINRVDCRA